MTKRMKTKRTLTDGEARRYGFRWKQVDVTRSHQWNGQLCIEVCTDHKVLHIYVSEAGHSIRVFNGTRELKAQVDG